MSNLDKNTIKNLILTLIDIKNRVNNYDVGGAANVLDSTASKFLLIDKKISDKLYKLYDSIKDRLYPIDNRPKLVPEFENGIINLVHFVCNYYLIQTDPTFERLVKISNVVVLKASRRDNSCFIETRELLDLIYIYDKEKYEEYRKEVSYCNTYGDYSRLFKQTQEICGNLFTIITDKVLKSLI